MAESITVTDNRTGEVGGDTDRRRRCLGGRVAQAAARHLVLRPGVHDDRPDVELHHLPRRRRRHPALPRLPDRAAGRAVDLPRGGLPADPRRAADRRAVRRLDARDHLPHLHPREHAQALRGGLPLRRPSHGHAAVGDRRPVDLLPRGQGHRRPRHPRQADHPADRQDADAGRGLPPLQRRHAVRVPRQLAVASPRTSCR